MPQTHSPLPWSARARSASDGALVIKTGAPEYIEVCCIAENSTRHEGPDNDRQMADAAFIVRAVNAHAELVAALERMLNAHDADVAAGSLIAMGNGNAADQARAALARAKGEA